MKTELLSDLELSEGSGCPVLGLERKMRVITPHPVSVLCSPWRSLWFLGNVHGVEKEEQKPDTPG